MMMFERIACLLSQSSLRLLSNKILGIIFAFINFENFLGWSLPHGSMKFLTHTSLMLRISPFFDELLLIAIENTHQILE
jgi:hypothetical protein